MEKVTISGWAVVRVVDYLLFLDDHNRPQESYIAEDGAFAIKENNVVLRVYVKPGDKPDDEPQTDRIEINNEYAKDEITKDDIKSPRLPRYISLGAFKRLAKTLKQSIDMSSHGFTSGIQKRDWDFENPFLSLERDINKLHDRVPKDQSFLK